MKSLLVILAIILVGAVSYIGYQLYTAETNTDTGVEAVPTGDIFAFADPVGTTLEVQYSENAETAFVYVNGTTYELTHAPAASGARYTNEDETVTFWEHQGEARLEIDGEAVVANAVLIDDNEQDAGTETDEESTPTASKSWVWQETGLPNGDVTTPDSGAFVLTLSDNERFTSTTDCNSVGGSYIAENELITFSDIYATKMFCEGSLENTYTEQLALVTSYVATAETLTLNLSEGGEMVFVAAQSDTATDTPEAAPLPETPEAEPALQ